MIQPIGKPPEVSSFSPKKKKKKKKKDGSCMELMPVKVQD